MTSIEAALATINHCGIPNALYLELLPTPSVSGLLPDSYLPP